MREDPISTVAIWGNELDGLVVGLREVRKESLSWFLSHSMTVDAVNDVETSESWNVQQFQSEARRIVITSFCSPLLPQHTQTDF